MANNYTHWFIRARLKTRQLLLLMALEEEGNIHRAAQVLNMTQPAAEAPRRAPEERTGRAAVRAAGVSGAQPPLAPHHDAPLAAAGQAE